MAMALATSDLRAKDLGHAQGAEGEGADDLSEAQPYFGHTGLQDHIGAGVGPDDAGDRAGSAQVGFPAPAVRRPLDQAAGLDLPPAIIVLVIKGAFGPIRRAHLDSSGASSLWEHPMVSTPQRVDKSPPNNAQSV